MYAHISAAIQTCLTLSFGCEQLIYDTRLGKALLAAALPV